MPPFDVLATIDQAAQQFGERPGVPTRSRRHGHTPRGPEHVRNYLLHRLGVSQTALAASSGRHPSTISESVQRGRMLVQAGAADHGFLDPTGRRYEQDPDSELGFSDPERP
jgi:hypothetical protein